MAKNPKEDASAIQVIRLVNRMVASTLMYFIPIVIFAQNMHRRAGRILSLAQEWPAEPAARPVLLPTVQRSTRARAQRELPWVEAPSPFPPWARRWNPWTGGEWCTPLDKFQTILLHLQTTYYLVRTSGAAAPARRL